MGRQKSRRNVSDRAQQCEAEADEGHSNNAIKADFSSSAVHFGPPLPPGGQSQGERGQSRVPRTPPAARSAPPQVVERPCNEQVEPPRQPCIYKEKAILTPEDALHQGLIYAGFDPARQNSVNSGRNDGRFKSFYGVSSKTGKIYCVPFRLLPFLYDQSMISLLSTCSSAVAPLFVDIRNGNPSISYKYCFLAMNWLYLVCSCMSCFTLDLKYINKR